MPTLKSLPATIRTLTDEEADRLDAVHPNVPLPANCITCGGTRNYRWYETERCNPIDWECNCEDQWILHRYLLHSGIGVHYQRLDWCDVEGADLAAQEKVRNYVEDDAWIRQGFGLVLNGNVGTGKTTLMSLAARGLIAKGHDVYHTTFSSMIDSFTSSWKSQDERAWYYRRVKNCRVLFIDDIGREFSEKLATSTLDDVLRHRIASGNPTCITTNIEISDLSQKYGMNVFSLLSECSTNYAFRGQDYRTSARMRREDERQKGLIRPLVLGAGGC